MCIFVLNVNTDWNFYAKVTNTNKYKQVISFIYIYIYI